MDMPPPINKPIQAKTMAELLPSLSGILSQDSIQTLTAKKKPRQTTFLTHTAEKAARPLTIAQMKADLLSLNVRSPKRNAPENAASNRKKGWNSSVKLDKKMSYTSNGQMKNNPVRKVLNFQPKSKAVPNPRFTMMNTETPKFPKPESRAKKALHLQGKKGKSDLNTPLIRISGVFNMPETPAINGPSKRGIMSSNKENISSIANIRKSVVPKPLKRHIPAVPNTPITDNSWKSSCDNSFLQKEKEINDEELINAQIKSTQNAAKLSQIASTPFKEYRNVQEYFNNSSCVTSPTAVQDNTIMQFDKTSSSDGNKREESVIVSLCELLSKATVTQTNHPSTELNELVQLQEQTQKRIKIIDNVIEVLKNMRESELKSLDSVRKMINEKKTNKTVSDNDDNDANKTLVTATADIKTEGTPSPQPDCAVGKPVSVIKSSHKSPSYKIPKKNAPLRKKIFHKSMPTVSVAGLQTPPNDNKALNMYMKMKEQMKFLNTPVVKQRHTVPPDTPATTSRNLQMQLDKLFNQS